MQLCFTFRAKPGKEKELEELLSDPEGGKRMAALLGATRNRLFFRDGRMVRILDLHDGAEIPSMYDLAQEHPPVKELLGKIGRIVEDGFDIDDEASMDGFDERVTIPLVYDVRP